MSKVIENGNLTVLKPLIICGNILCICPPVGITLVNQSAPIFYKTYAVFIAVSSLLLNILLAQQKAEILGSFIPMHLRYMENVSQMALASFSCYICISGSFLHGKEFCEFFVDIDKVDKMLKKERIRKCKLKFVKIFLLLNLTLAAFIISDATIFFNTLGFDWYKFYMLKVLQFYHCIITVFFGTVFSIQIRERFVAFNNLLRNSQLYTIEGLVTITAGKSYDKQYCIKDIQKLHTMLCQMVEKLNRIFGIIFVFAIITSIIMMLHFIVQILALVVFKVQVVGLDFSGDNHVVSVLIMGVVIVFLQMATLAYVGEGVKNETSKTQEKTYAILNAFPANSSTPWQKSLKKELLLLAMQTSSRKPQIEASGFFTVNFRMIGFIITSLTSYVIVAVQFLTQLPMNSHHQNNSSV